MTYEETAQYYAAREAYSRKCEDFKMELEKYLSNYETRKLENFHYCQVYNEVIDCPYDCEDCILIGRVEYY